MPATADQNDALRNYRLAALFRDDFEHLNPLSEPVSFKLGTALYETFRSD